MDPSWYIFEARAYRAKQRRSSEIKRLYRQEKTHKIQGIELCACAHTANLNSTTESNIEKQQTHRASVSLASNNFFTHQLLKWRKKHKLLLCLIVGAHDERNALQLISVLCSYRHSTAPNRFVRTCALHFTNLLCLFSNSTRHE